MMPKSWAICVLLPLLCSACTDTVSRPARIGSTPALLTTADLRLVLERPGRPGGPTIVCAEPTPDVAKALDTALKVSADVTTPAQLRVGGAVTNATAEQLAELSGRVPGVIALRDGLFRACEAYANGVLGASVYALIVSRYGDLLATLLLADAAAGATSRDLARLAGLQLLAVDAAAKSKDTPQKDDKAKVADILDASKAPLMQQVAFARPSVVPIAAPTAAPGAVPIRPVRAAAVDPAAQQAGPKPGDAISSMLGEYIDHPPIGPLLVSCMNAFDPTSSFAGHPGTLLGNFCPSFLSNLGNAVVSYINARSRRLR